MNIDKQTSDLFRDSSKRRAWILYQLSLKDMSIASIARDVGISRQAMWQALVKPYPRAEKIIAECLNLPPQTLFPERYTSSGEPNRKRGRPSKQS